MQDPVSHTFVRVPTTAALQDLSQQQEALKHCWVELIGLDQRNQIRNLGVNMLALHCSQSCHKKLVTAKMLLIFFIYYIYCIVVYCLLYFKPVKHCIGLRVYFDRTMGESQAETWA